MKLIKKIGIFNPDGEIVLHPGISFSWKSLSNKKVPELPQGTPLDIDVTLDEKALLSGNHGIVWATYDLLQAEIICNALLAQNITSTIGKVEMEDRILFLIKIYPDSYISEAMDFIWRKEGGLRLQPDWTYPDGEVNASFEKWVGA